MSVEPSSIATLQQLLVALNALPEAWADKIPVNAILIGEDVESPTIATDDPSLVLFPSEVWMTGEDAWRDVGVFVDEGEVRDYALDAPTISAAKDRIVTMLRDYEWKLQVPTPEPEPVPTEPEEPGTAIIPAPTTELQPPPKLTPTQETEVPKGKGFPWLWVGLGTLGFAGLVALLITARRASRRMEPAPRPLRGPKMKGDYCEEKLAPKSAFDPRSFRYKKSGDAWLITGCPTGYYDARRQECRKGTRAYVIMRPAGKRCPVGEKRLRKG